MKKVFQFILISAVAIGSFLSPISAALNKNGIDIVKNDAWAADISPANFSAKIDNSRTKLGDTAVTIYFTVDIDTNKPEDYESFRTHSGILIVRKKASDATNPTSNPVDLYKLSVAAADSKSAKQPVSMTIVGLKEQTTYSIEVVAQQGNDEKILATTSLKTLALGQGSVTGDETKTVIGDDLMPECGLLHIYGCVIQVIYYLFWMPTSFLAAVAGKLMDIFIFYSINSTSYNQSSFITEGWKVVRDIANIGFIFILLFIALRTILNLGGSQNKRMITWVVIIALIINFSLFFTKVIVDSGNIVAGVLYNNIGAVAQKDGKDAPVDKGSAGEESISEALVNQFDPQKIIASAGVTPENKNEMQTPFLVVVILAIVVNLFMIFTFLAICLIFVGRTVGLMISMIFSPFAFMSITIPGSGKILKQWSWDQWFPELISMTFMAPIFIFFLWLIMLFLNVGILKGLGDKMSQDGNLLGSLVAVVLPFLLIVALLTKAKTVAQEMGGEIGAALNKMAGTAIGVVGGVALGGIAMAGRAVIGGAAAEGGIASRYGTGRFRRGGVAEETVAKAPVQELKGINKITARARNAVAEEQAVQERMADYRTAPFLKPAAIVPTFGGTPADRLRLQRREKEQAAEKEKEESITRINLVSAGKLTPVPAPAVTTPTTPTSTTTPLATIAATTPAATKATTTTPAAETTPATTGPTATAPTTSAPTLATEPIVKEKVETTEKKGEKEGMTLKDLAAGKAGGIQGFMARRALGTLEGLTKSSFDLRNTKLMKFVQKQTGIDFGTAKKGGYEKDYKDRKEAELKYAKMLEPSDFEKLELNRLDSLHKDLTHMMEKNPSSPEYAKWKTEAESIKKFDVKKDKNGNVVMDKYGKPELTDNVIGGSWKAEDSKMKNKKNTRIMSYGKTVDSGTGLNFIASKVLGKNTANNVAIGNAIRSTATAKSEKDKLYESFKKAAEAESPETSPVTPPTTPPTTPPATPTPKP